MFRRFWSLAGSLVAAFVLVGGIGLSPASAAEPTFPPFTGYVVDGAGILSPSTRAQLTETLGAFQRKTRNQVVVATVKTLEGYPIEDYGYRLGRAWGVGQKGKDTGAILLVAPNERQVRIEVGYGLEGELTDAMSKRIIERDILPAFRRGDFNGGVLAGTASILRVLGGNAADSGGASGTVARQPSSQLEGFVQSARTDPTQLVIFLVAMFVFVLFAFLRAHGFYGPVYPLPYGVWGRRSGGGFGAGGGGFSGGGFSGGGGGSFGGGGASGGW
jgi:uncharacterized protein